MQNSCAFEHKIFIDRADLEVPAYLLNSINQLPRKKKNKSFKKPKHKFIENLGKSRCNNTKLYLRSIFKISLESYGSVI